MTAAPQPPPAGPLQPAALQPGNGLAVAGMVLGIISVATSLIACIPGLGFICWVCGVLGVVFGVIGLNKAKQLNGVGAKQAKTGLVCSIIGIAVGLILTVAVWFGLMAFMKFSTRGVEKVTEGLQKAAEMYGKTR